MGNHYNLLWSEDLSQQALTRLVHLVYMALLPPMIVFIKLWLFVSNNLNHDFFAVAVSLKVHAISSQAETVGNFIWKLQLLIIQHSYQAKSTTLIRLL